MLAARFPLFIPSKHCIQLLRRGRRLIRKGGDVTGIIHRSAYLCRNVYRYGSAAPILFGLALHLSLAKISADP
jgi:hypothetical protein